MHEEVENRQSPPKKPFIFYAIVAFVYHHAAHYPGISFDAQALGH